MLKNRSFTVGTITAALSFFAFSSITVILPAVLQDDRGFSATMSGLIMLRAHSARAIAQFFGGKALDPVRRTPGGVDRPRSRCASARLMMSLISMDSWIWWVSIWQFIRQIGMGFVLMPITTWSLNCLSPRRYPPAPP